MNDAVEYGVATGRVGRRYRSRIERRFRGQVTAVGPWPRARSRTRSVNKADRGSTVTALRPERFEPIDQTAEFALWAVPVHETLEIDPAQASLYGIKVDSG